MTAMSIVWVLAAIRSQPKTKRQVTATETNSLQILDNIWRLAMGDKQQEATTMNANVALSM